VVYDACELGKHIRSSYASFGSRSSCLFDLIHFDVWRSCPITTLNGFRYFISFINYFSRVAWFYLVKNKSDVIVCFKKNHIMVQAQHSVVVKVLRSDNEIKYTNKVFGEYLSSHGIQHQITFPYTLEQKGLKRGHLLNVIRSMMISMNVL
jgi:Integrase core domain